MKPGDYVRLEYRDKNGKLCVVRGMYRGTTASGMIKIQETKRIYWCIPERWVVKLEKEK